jgi:hypothetical protein
VTGKTYSIIRSHREAVRARTIETVVETGLSWEAADSQRNELQQAERDANPLKSSWTMDIFIVRMEVGDAKGVCA